MSGRYIALEGGEGSGKSTQAARLAESLDAVLTHEPGATAVGRQVRALLLNPDTSGLDYKAEALLMAADRSQHLAEVVLPALASDRDVVSDRSAYSTLAYQGYGRGLDLAGLRAICNWACDGRWPDLVVLLDLPVEESQLRLGGHLDRFEKAGIEFHTRVRDGYLDLAAEEPERWVVVDASGSVEEVWGRVQEVLADRLT